jgi:hypothetical protein
LLRLAFRAGHRPSTIRNTLLGVRAIFRRAIARGEVALNPTSGLELPAVRGTRDGNRRQTMVEIGVDKSSTIGFPAPLMCTTQELGAFLARETAAGETGLPVVRPNGTPRRSDRRVEYRHRSGVGFLAGTASEMIERTRWRLPGACGGRRRRRRRGR